MEKDGEDNQKVKKVSWIVSQMFALKLEHVGFKYHVKEHVGMDMTMQTF